MATGTDTRAASPGGAQGLAQAWLRRGWLAWVLLPVAVCFGLLSGLRRWLYRVGLLKPVPVGVPVVVVGNLIAGGAGKTPTVMAVVSLLRSDGYRPGVISRGYGRDADEVVDVQPSTDVKHCGDEPLLMRLRLKCPVVVGRDRVAAGRELLRLHPEVDIVVSDDGLQHLRLARDAQVLVFDQRGAGNGWPLPAGPLREPLPRSVPARSVVLYNADSASTALPGCIARRSFAGAVSLQGWRAGERASAEALHALSARPLVATAGMAHPQRFFDMLSKANLSFTPLPLPDHFDYATLPWPEGTPDVVLTEKDAIKLDPQRMGTTRVWVVPLDFHPGADFDRALLALLPSPSNRTNHGHTTS
ncbi:tetraacyldisaccharide 4'-kinase [Piscinibacter terrae]|uniref:Tetraacyldisaccharide 4'-kinase n=1 Tax=Piscinibacter terrae TaxID=2496871 RepID=A0A3N7HQ60_9BURK|nr:tetraacyldisaccharide 4'-kinase [Albitalea terrae]RQP22901.1 tetraacyldisaccharide 4'-kinase [Albitalea terrae]